MDALADELKVQVGQEDLTARLLTTSRQYGVEPQQLFAYLQENNQLPSMFADVRRELAVRAVARAATVTDSDGNTIDTGELFGTSPRLRKSPTQAPKRQMREPKREMREPKTPASRPRLSMPQS
ncbi:bacterial trigger factor family protein [Mycobacterium kansasii]|uniref:Bacterial trigger factor family protein n=1 Tax=Mycobacterium kansasii TaxID=1768 RepID=A0A1V3XH84_MYCKA|nr:bacterial trigger factor family protein [Mycobacterium kansasii]